MNAPWYYATQNQQFGPVATEELKRLLAEGNLDPQALVWKDGMADWIPASQCAQLRPAGPPPLPKGTGPALPPRLPSSRGADTTPPPRRTRPFEVSAPGGRPATAAAAPPPPPPQAPQAPQAPQTPESLQALQSVQAAPKAPAKPGRPPLSVNDTLIATFVLAGSLVLAVLAGFGGSPIAGLVFLFVALVANVSFWVRLAIFLYRAWGSLPWKAQRMKPLWAAVSLFIPLANLVLVFKAIQGLSQSTNEVLAERGHRRSAPDALGTAVAVVFVLNIVLPFAIPNPVVALLFAVTAVALAWQWMDRQCAACNVLIGHTDLPQTALGLRIGVLSTGALALLVAVAVATSGMRSQQPRGSSPGVVPAPQGLFGTGGAGNDELLDLARREANRNAAFAEQLRNINSAYSGGQIFWQYPAQTEEEVRLRAMIEQEAARNRQFLEQLQQIRQGY